MSRTPGASIRRPVLLLLLALATALALGLAANADAAPKQVPCTPIGGGKHNCSWRVAGNGKTGGSPVLDSNGKRVGFLHKGANWITCQARGRTERSGTYFNNVWGRTVADNDRAGWVNAVWASGGDNDGGFEGVPACTKGHPPLKGGSGPAPTPTPTPAPPAGGGAKGASPVPCTKGRKGRFNCRWRVGGNGRSGGSPVLDSNGKRVGFLHQGTNYITCQARGRTERSGKYFNNTWGRTVADDRKAGWVNAVWASGGDNNGGFSGAPACKKGHPPLKGGSSAPPAPQPQATVSDTCSGAVKEDQTISARYTYTYLKRQIIAPGNVATAPTTHIEKGPDRHRFGSVRIIGGTCHTKKGWRPLHNATVVTASDGQYTDGGGNAAVKGKNSQRGWGLGQARIAPGVVDVQMSYCTTDDSLGSLVDVLEAIPIPGLKYAYSVVKSGATLIFGKRIRPAADTKCGDMGSDRIAMYADKRGRLRARIANLSLGEVDLRQDVRPNDPSQYYEQTKDPDTPRLTYGG